MLDGARVIAIVPCYDVADRVREVASTMPAFVDQILLIDDASRDGTREVLARCASSDPRAMVLTHPRNRGVGAALVTGYRFALASQGADNDAFVVLAGDGQMDPTETERVVRPVVRREADYVKGNRFAGDAREMPRARRLVGEIASAATRLATGLDVSDSQCGFTALSRAACARLDLEGLWPRYGYPNDLLGQLAARRLRVAEVPIRARYRGEKSGLKLLDVAKIFAIIGRTAVTVRGATFCGLLPR